MGIFRNRKKGGGRQGPGEGSRLAMVTTYGESYYAWNGKLYESDIVRACIRPKVKAVGKLVPKHIRAAPSKGIVVNPEPYLRFLLEEPNPYMTGQQMQQKVETQLCLNNNAFILVVRDANGYPMQLYPVPCVSAEAVYGRDGELFLKFQYRNGNSGTFAYQDVIHLKQDYNQSDIFGESPAKALAQMMEVVGTIDQGIIKAIRNSSVVRWLLKFNTSLRPEKIKEQVDLFVQNYLSIETDTFGAAGVDAKADVVRIEPKDYVPNAAQSDRTIERIYSFFNTNKKIVQSDWMEDEWNAYYEAEVEPDAIQWGKAYTIRLFSRKERGFGNEVIFEASNLQCASLSTKLGLQAMVDRGAMTPNEWRAVINMAPVEGGDVPVRRLDTEVVAAVGRLAGLIDGSNYERVAGSIAMVLAAAGGLPGLHQEGGMAGASAASGNGMAGMPAASGNGMASVPATEEGGEAGEEAGYPGDDHPQRL